MPTPADPVVRALLAELAAGGVRHAVIAPGSRNTPLTAALTLEGGAIRPWLHLDERSAGYFALGIARQLREPVALVCTSGTAAANFLPAAVEANLSRVPLVLLTADRPPELRDVGAPQTIDQVNLFGSHVKYTCDLEAPRDGHDLDSVTATTAASAAAAVAMARSEPPGPVHLNLPFDEPLIAADSASAQAPAVAPSEPGRGLVPALGEDEIERIAALISGRRGLVVAGPESAGLEAPPIAALASHLGWPLLADPLSGLRAGVHDLDVVIDSYDVLARDAGIASTLQPEVVLRFGASPTSKPLTQWLASLEVPQLLVDPGARWRDPDGVCHERIQAIPDAFATALASADAEPADESWSLAWGAADRAAREAMTEAIRCFDEPFEGRPALDLAEALPDGATLVVGNSMPVRDLDSFLPATPRDIRIVGTRGASGIDGVASTAVGAAAVASGPVALLVGDLSFLHDLNGLWPVRRYDLSLTVVLINNDGGGIFHFLPQRQLIADRFEEWWGTPHGLDLGHAVALHGGRHASLPIDGREGITRALATPGLDVLELRTERDRNVELHQQVWDAGIGAAQSALDR